MLSVVSCFKHFVNINISFSNRSYEFVKPLDTNYMYIRDEYDKCPESLTNGAQCEKLLQGRSSIFMDIYLGRLEVIPFLRLSELNALILVKSYRNLLINSIILSNIRWNWPIPAGFRQSEYPKIPNRIVHITRVLPICCITETSTNSIKDPLQICLLELPTILVPAISHKHKITCRFLTKTLSKLTESSYWLAIFFNRLKRIEPWRNFEHYRISVVCTNCPCLNVFVIWLKTRCIRQQNRLWLRKLRQFATMVSIFPT